MKMTLLIFTMLCCSVVYPSGLWDEARLSELLRTSGRFVEDDYDEDDEDDIPNWERDALPLFEDVLAESGWTTNRLVYALINVASNGLSSATWQCDEMRRSSSMAIKQLSDINHPAVTNYFHTLIGCDIHGLETIVIPSLFKYTHLEPDVIASLYSACTYTNIYDKAAPEIVMGLLDGLGNVPVEDREDAKVRVAKFMYQSMRQVTSSQTWQDEELARLIPSYSNSVERLEQLRYLKLHSSRQYEREKAAAEFERLHLMPSNTLTSVPWIANP